jgi:Anti-sigma-K factor rskA
VNEPSTAEDRALAAVLAELEEAGAAAATAAESREVPAAGGDGLGGMRTAREAEAGGAGKAADVAEPRQAAAGAEAVGAETETLARLYHETLGLLPFALPAATPRPELRRRLLEQAGTAKTDLGAASGGEAVAGRPDAATGAAADARPPRVPADVPARPRGGAAAIAGAAVPEATRSSAAAADAGRFRAAAAGARPSGASRWPLALAAALILALLGTAAWMYQGLRQQATTIARLAAERSRAVRQLGDVEERLARMDHQVSSLRESVAVVTSPDVAVCNLRAATPELGEARGILFVAADHQHWYMSLRGLRPAARGKVYQLWFVADQGAVSGGTFDARPGGPAELRSEHMPAGTRAARITVEPSPGSPAPSGPDVLRNADSLHTL